jgi:HAD superfamily hydrolase (TIGR01509 family)
MDKTMNYLDGSWAFIFDMDGLMLDTEHTTNQAWQRAAADFGYDLTDEMMRECVGYSLVMSEFLQKKFFGEDYPFQKIRDKKVIYYEESIKQKGIPIKKGLIPLLDLLESRHIRKAVASSTVQPYVNQRLQMTHLFHRFNVIISGSEVEKVKPDPALYQEAARKMGVDSMRCLVLEDTPVGVKAAEAAGMPVILVPDLAPLPPEICAMALGVFTSLDDVRLFLIGQELK